MEPWVKDIGALHTLCRGNMVRVQEELLNQHGIHSSYSTLTRFCRDQGIGVEEKIPTAAIRTAPGLESQHDTSPYTIEIGAKLVKRQCASLVLGYSRMAYIQFYPRFTRFHMKIFLSDAFEYFGGVCQRCVIDNTSLAILCGTGRMAQVAPEMEAFEKRFSFKFMAHELMHANRKGKCERDFDYVENNFLAGRTFKDDADLNRRAIEWLEKTANPRRMREFKASPLELFAAEKPHLIPLPLYVPEVYQILRRDVDRYGYVSLDGKRYSVPSSALSRNLMLRETKDEVIVLEGRQELARHPKLTDADPRTQSTLPGHGHRPHRPRPGKEIPEEAHLKALGAVVEGYLGQLKVERGARYFWSVKKLYRLVGQYKAQDLIAAISRATQCRLFDVNRIEGVLLENMAQQDFLLPLGQEDYEKNPEFLKGASTPVNDLSPYAIEAEQSEQQEEKQKKEGEAGEKKGREGGCDARTNTELP